MGGFWVIRKLSFMLKRNWHFLLILFLCLDIAYSFCQHFHVALDGDLPNIILPAKQYQPLMDDPLGLSVLLENESYASPNRFFAHWFTAEYFKNIPHLLQKIVSPIDSVYLASAIIKTFIQFLLIGILSIFITNKNKITDKSFLIVAILLTPLFQTSGYYQYMGVIDKATTYTLFYAFPISLLLLFFLPFYKKLYSNINIELSWWRKIMLFFLAIYLSLNGPLIPPIVILTIGLIFSFQIFQIYKKEREKSIVGIGKMFLKRIGKETLFFFLVFCFFSMYSFYIGLNTSEGLNDSISIMERYQKVPMGIFNMLTQKLGFPILILIILINLFLMKKQSESVERKKIFIFLQCLSVFAMVYILLLPLGGYREYRPNIIRRDTFLPVTLLLFYTFGMTSFYLIQHLLPKYRKWYVVGLFIVGFNFMIVDLPDFQNNKCERDALEKISNTPKGIIQLENDCLIMTWIKVKDPEFTETNSQVLQMWNIIEKPTLYYQK